MTPSVAYSPTGKSDFFDAMGHGAHMHAHGTAAQARQEPARRRRANFFEELHHLLSAAAVIAAAGCAPVLQQLHNNRSGHGTRMSAAGRGRARPYGRRRAARAARACWAVRVR